MRLRPPSRSLLGLLALACAVASGCGDLGAEYDQHVETTRAARAQGKLYGRLDESYQALRAGDGQRALALADQVLAALAAQRDVPPDLQARAWAARGEALTEVGAYAEAITELERARAMQAPLGDRNGYLLTTHSLAAALDYSERSDEAEVLFREVVEGRRLLDGARSIALAQALANLGICMEFQHRSDAAIATLTEAVSLYEALGATDDSGYDGALNSLGNAHGALDRDEVALSYYQRALQIRERNLGPDHPSVAVVLFNITSALLDLGRAEEALAPIERALRLRRAMLPPDHPWLVQTEERHREVLALLGRAAGP